MHTTAPTRPVEPTYEQLASGEDEWIRYLFGPSLVPLRPGLPAAEAIAHAGLGWRVDQLPLLADQGDRLAPITTHVANVRGDTRAPIGVVGAKYRPIQNREALARRRSDHRHRRRQLGRHRPDPRRRTHPR